MSKPQHTLYEVIELPRTASQKVIEEQCIRLGERYRPDMNPGDPNAALTFAQVEKAYETLADPGNRAAYDVELLRQSSLLEGARLDKFIWMLVLLVTVVIQATHSGDFLFALGYSSPWFVVGMVLSPIWWGVTKKRRIAPWQWFDWLNAGAYITVGLLILSVFVNSWVRTQVGGGVAVEGLQRDETARINAEEASRVAEETKRAAQPPARVAAGEAIYLQVGAFQKAADADNLKAKLAMLGVETGVQEISVPARGTLYRVRVGPFANLEDMNRARGLLSRNGIQTDAVKVRETLAQPTGQRYDLLP